MGAEHAFDEYSPHVTLVSNLQVTEAAKKRLQRVSDKYRGAELKFYGETIQDLKHHD